MVFIPIPLIGSNNTSIERTRQAESTVIIPDPDVALFCRISFIVFSRDTLPSARTT